MPTRYHGACRAGFASCGASLYACIRRTDVLRHADRTNSSSVSSSVLAPEEHRGHLSRFGCAPDRNAERVKAVFREIDALKAAGPTEKQVSDVREALLREFETHSKENGYLLSQIYLRYQVPQDLGEFFGVPDDDKTVNAAMIQEAARRYLDTANYVQVTLSPHQPTNLDLEDKARQVTRYLELRVAEHGLS